MQLRLRQVSSITVLFFIHPLMGQQAETLMSYLNFRLKQYNIRLCVVVAYNFNDFVTDFFFIIYFCNSGAVRACQIIVIDVHFHHHGDGHLLVDHVFLVLKEEMCTFFRTSFLSNYYALLVIMLKFNKFNTIHYFQRKRHYLVYIIIEFDYLLWNFFIQNALHGTSVSTTQC